MGWWARGGAALFDIERDTKVVLLQAAYLVTKPCRFLELQIARSSAHALFKIGDDGTERMAVIRVAMQRLALACSTNCPPLGAVTGVTTETLQPNS